MIKHPAVLRIVIMLSVLAAFALSIALWMQTPALFEYFNQAFCAH